MSRKSMIATIVVGLAALALNFDAFAQRRRGGQRGGPQAKTPGKKQAGGQPGGRFGAQGRRGRGGATNKLFAALDANGDGVISRAEMDDAIQAFAKLDENKDGKLSKEEAGATGGGHGHGGAGRGRAAAGQQGGFGRGRGGRFRGRGGNQQGGPAGGRFGRGGFGRGGANESARKKRPPMEIDQ